MRDLRSCTVAAVLGGMLAVWGPAAAPALAQQMPAPAVVGQEAGPGAAAEASTEANMPLGLLAGTGAGLLGGGLFIASRRKRL